MRIICQIGYSKSLGRKKEGQKLSAQVNGVDCSWEDRTGRFITPFTSARKGTLWYYCELELEQGDTICLKAATALLGGGVDERRTWEAIYVVDENADIQEVEVAGVGAKGYPILKGKLTNLGTVTEADNREADIEAFLEDEGFE